jgi:RND superfamily putative drug exporter
MAAVPTAAHGAGRSSRSPRRAVSTDGHTAYDIVFRPSPDDGRRPPSVGQRSTRSRSRGLRSLAAGVLRRRPDRLEEDLRRSELISPIAGLALLVVFGSVVAASVPLAVGGAAVVVALAVVYFLASSIPMSIFVLNLATLLGLGLGVDYSLLMTSRFREELARRSGWETIEDDAGRAKARDAAVEGLPGRPPRRRAGRVLSPVSPVLLGLIGLILSSS